MVFISVASLLSEFEPVAGANGEPAWVSMSALHDGMDHTNNMMKTVCAGFVPEAFETYTMVWNIQTTC